MVLTKRATGDLGEVAKTLEFFARAQEHLHAVSGRRETTLVDTGRVGVGRLRVVLFAELAKLHEADSQQVLVLNALALRNQKKRNKNIRK